MMITKTKGNIKRKKRINELKVVEVNYVQVPDAEDRLKRVFKMLLAS